MAIDAAYVVIKSFGIRITKTRRKTLFFSKFFKWARGKVPAVEIF
jgi:hypothetical protein